MRKILFTLLSALVLSACHKDKAAPLQPVDIAVSLQLSADNSVSIPYKGAVVTLTNATNNNKYKDSISTDTNTVFFQKMIPGTYNVSVELKLSPEAYLAATGQKVAGSVIYTGTLTAAAVSPENNLKVDIKTGGGSDSWVIKQIYYAGSDTKDGALFRDQFFEIYNNSDHVLYADSLYFAQVEGVSTASSSLDLSKGYYLKATGQWDWSLSAGNTVANANTDYVYSSMIFRIPGNGSTYPVQPGKSLIIAQTAINHKVPFTDINGKEVGVRNPDLTVDLSKADFDVYMGNFPGTNPLASDLNTSTTHVTVIANPNRDLILDNLGREGLIIFKTTADIKSTWKLLQTPDNNPKDTRLYFQIPKAGAQIFDAVEMQPTDIAKHTPKRLPADLDAGFAYVPNGAYSSQAILRKTQNKVDGRIVLQDTNNSILDFVVIKADPSKNAFTSK
ncbi:DUF4876 domain-containing protein [Chitinophaga sp. Cy-1792]|uniref:DUF4876 domain-containing protein n=1 Tax=Chitinophaga sp. Cy-1792 TaxID=2608339 RepID=UPI00141E6441|nr:DUF4876 domain-containing protein [Chitinophaga sp. Cy-1792]NIG54379.1 DUF4876 domain-containing protein [Chitinophaga sp. Cy-1792]